jgi:hypothetical protein
MQKPATGHNSKLASSISDPHNLSPFRYSKLEFSKRFPAKVCMRFSVFPVLVAYRVHCYVLDFTIITIQYGLYKSWISLCNIVNCSIPSSFLRPDIFLSSHHISAGYLTLSSNLFPSSFPHQTYIKHVIYNLLTWLWSCGWTRITYSALTNGGGGDSVCLMARAGVAQSV